MLSKSPRNFSYTNVYGFSHSLRTINQQFTMTLSSRQKHVRQETGAEINNKVNFQKADRNTKV